MPDTSDKRAPETASDEIPSAAAGLPVASDPAPQAEQGQQAGPQPGEPPIAQTPTEMPRRRRRRRRRRRAVQPTNAENVPVSATAAENISASATVSSVAGEAAPPGQQSEPSSPQPGASPSAEATADHPRTPRRRRRRRRPRLPGERGSASREGGASQILESPPGDLAAHKDSAPDRKPRDARWARHGRGKEAVQEPGSREGDARGSGPRKPGHWGKDARARGPGGPKHRPYGGKRGVPDKQEQKLYSSEAVVDHGFEDIAAGDDGSEARRIDWTIIKRTVADQRSTRTVSTVYVLRRDGVDTEFPYLGAARAAVNKKIVHPEKLTRPKSDYAAVAKK